MRKNVLILFVTILSVACNLTKQVNDSASYIELSNNENSNTLKDTINLTPTASRLSEADSIAASFFGGSTYVFISKDRPNGYEISILKSGNLCIWHFKKGEDIDHYIATHNMPRFLESELYCYLEEYNYPVNKDINVVYYTNFSEYIPIKDDIAEVIEFAFVDVNFDGKEEFVVEYDTFFLWNHYYACFDLETGYNKEYPGFLSPMRGEVYGNLANGSRSRTTIDHAKEEIHIISKIGNSDIVETIAKKIDYEVKIVERIDYVNYSYEKSKTTYKLLNDTLKKVASEIYHDETFFKNKCAEYGFDYW